MLDVKAANRQDKILVYSDDVTSTDSETSGIASECPFHSPSPARTVESTSVTEAEAQDIVIVREDDKSKGMTEEELLRLVEDVDRWLAETDHLNL